MESFMTRLFKIMIDEYGYSNNETQYLIAKYVNLILRAMDDIDIRGAEFTNDIIRGTVLTIGMKEAQNNIKNEGVNT